MLNQWDQFTKYLWSIWHCFRLLGCKQEPKQNEGPCLKYPSETLCPCHFSEAFLSRKLVCCLFCFFTFFFSFLLLFHILFCFWQDFLGISSLFLRRHWLLSFFAVPWPFFYSPLQSPRPFPGEKYLKVAGYAGYVHPLALCQHLFPRWACRFMALMLFTACIPSKCYII